MKTKKKNDVTKALNPEEKTLLANIKSMVTELEQMDGGEEVMEADDVVIPEDKEEEITMKSSEGATASDDADKRKDEDLPDTTKENITAVKTLIRHMDRKLKKSQSSDINLTQALNGVTMVLQKVCKRLDEHDQAFGNLFTGLGISEQIEKSITPPKSKDKPVQSTDTARVLKELLGLTDQDERNVSKSRSLSDVRKSLADRNILTALLKE
jgi:hypothetical protein